MEPHVALRRAADALYDATGCGPDDALPPDTEALCDALLSLAEAFAPYDGDDPADAAKRKAQAMVCNNCGLMIEGVFLPSPMHRAAHAMTRRGICPRCFATKNIVMNWIDPKVSARESLAGRLGNITVNHRVAGDLVRLTAEVTAAVSPTRSERLVEAISAVGALPVTVEIAVPT